MDRVLREWMDVYSKPPPVMTVIQNSGYITFPERFAIPTERFAVTKERFAMTDVDMKPVCEMTQNEIVEEFMNISCPIKAPAVWERAATLFRSIEDFKLKSEGPLSKHWKRIFNSHKRHQKNKTILIPMRGKHGTVTHWKAKIKDLEKTVPGVDIRWRYDYKTVSNDYVHSFEIAPVDMVAIRSYISSQPEEVVSAKTVRRGVLTSYHIPYHVVEC